MGGEWGGGGIGRKRHEKIGTEKSTEDAVDGHDFSPPFLFFTSLVFSESEVHRLKRPRFRLGEIKISCKPLYHVVSILTDLKSYINIYFYIIIIIISNKFKIFTYKKKKWPK